jgi:tRNA threonylcarbamoyl adenosine modification protein (Sua5/YciO/YrdC/YwlC family)
MTLALVIHPEHPEPRKIAHAAEVLEDGGVALYPTDTVYALGCAIDARKAVERLYRMKRMDPRQPLSMICADLSDISRYAIVSDFAYRQMRRLLPGPFTFILEASREVPRILLDKRRQIGIRVPSSPICAALVTAIGRPLLTTSAVPPDGEQIMDVEEGKDAFGAGLDLTIDGGSTPGRPSTVVSLLHDEIVVLREGLGADELFAAGRNE